MGLSFRVRNGTGRFPHAMTAVTLAPDPGVPGGRWGWEICGYNLAAPVPLGVVVQLWCCCVVVRSSSNGFVVWEPHSGRKQSCYLLPLFMV